ncbi:MAG: hypothetical protein M0R22_00440 [Dehalococcoidia bacterium]|nr:hypothetical protein [Dehalococcoidia bacterium]
MKNGGGPCSSTRTLYKIIVNGRHQGCALTKSAAKSICRRMRAKGKRCSVRKQTHTRRRQVMRLG